MGVGSRLTGDRLLAEGRKAAIIEEIESTWE